MKRKMNLKREYLVLVIMLLPFIGMAQDFDTSQAEGFINQLRRLAPLIMIAGLVAGGLMNLGLITGTEKDYVKYFRMIIIYVIAAGFLSAMIAVVSAMSF